MSMGYPSKPGPATNAPPPPPPYAARPNPGPRMMYRGPPPRLQNVRPSPIQTRDNGGDLSSSNERDGAPHATPTNAPKSSTGTPIVSRGPSPDGSKGTVASMATQDGLPAEGGGKERNSEKTPDGKNHAEFMVNAVDNIIAAGK